MQKDKIGLVGASGAAITSAPLGKIIWEPMPGKIVCKVLGEREFWDRSGRIIKPITVQNPRTTAEVLAVYEPFIDYGDKDETTSYLAVGDVIVFGKHGGVQVTYGEDTVVILREQEVLTKVKIEKSEDLASIGVESNIGADLDGIGG